MKYVETKVVFEEVPDEITLAINISNCPVRCKDCHSPHLWQDIGTELTKEELEKLIDNNKGITCVAIMGGDSSTDDVLKALKIIKSKGLKSCWYSGKDRQNEPATKLLLSPYLDYLKTGPYIKKLGGLDSPITNQRFYKVMYFGEGQYIYYDLKDITYKFRKNERNYS